MRAKISCRIVLIERNTQLLLTRRGLVSSFSGYSRAGNEYSRAGNYYYSTYSFHNRETVPSGETREHLIPIVGLNVDRLSRYKLFAVSAQSIWTSHIFCLKPLKSVLFLFLDLFTCKFSKKPNTTAIFINWFDHPSCCRTVPFNVNVEIFN